MVRLWLAIPRCDALADPPVGVGAEAEAPGGIESLHRPLQPQGALLHQVEQLHAALQVFLGHGHHQPQVGLDHPLLGAAALVQNQAQFGGTELAAVGPALRLPITLLLQQPFTPLHQPGQGELLFGSQQVDPADLLEVLTHQVGGGGAGQGRTPESIHPAQRLRGWGAFIGIALGLAQPGAARRPGGCRVRLAASR